MLKIFDFPQYVVAMLHQQEYDNIKTSVSVINDYAHNEDTLFTEKDFNWHKERLKIDLAEVFEYTGIESKQFIISKVAEGKHSLIKQVWPCIKWPTEPRAIDGISSFYDPSYYSDLQEFRRYPNGLPQHGLLIPAEDFSFIAKQLAEISDYYVILKKKFYIENPYYIKDELNPPYKHLKTEFNGIRMILYNMGEVI